MSSIAAKLASHLGKQIKVLPVLRQVVDEYEQPNLHLAIEELLADSVQLKQMFGVVERDYSVSLARLTAEEADVDFREGPVEYLDVELEANATVSCVKRGVLLLLDESIPVVLLIGREQDSYPPKTLVEVMAADKERGQKFLRRLVRMTRMGKAYRGKVFSIEKNCYGGLVVKFHRLPEITREQIILPEELLNRIERHTISFSRHAERLKSAGRHLKRGILLHGPPGTGKTLSSMYLASRMKGRTVILLTGGGMSSIEAACSLARMLQPVTVVLEDVDLIGTQRHMQTVDANALLFELLNQMDGLAEDCDILFVLTTNRPDILEPALSARPGRIDQALEVPLPDARCRKRLLELYGEGLNLEAADLNSLNERLEGVSAAFIRELLRKAALLAADEQEGQAIQVDDVHLRDALDELVLAGGRLTQTLLGAAVAGGPEDRAE
jgi:hypothetical protein